MPTTSEADSLCAFYIFQEISPSPSTGVPYNRRKNDRLSCDYPPSPVHMLIVPQNPNLNFHDGKSPNIPVFCPNPCCFDRFRVTFLQIPGMENSMYTIFFNDGFPKYQDFLILPQSKLIFVLET